MLCLFVVTENMLKNMAEKAGMNIEEYTSETYNALTGNNTKTDLFIYQIIQNKSLFEVNILAVVNYDNYDCIQNELSLKC